MKYKDWLNIWLDNYIKPSAKIRTYERYLEIIKHHIIDRLGNYNLEELSPIVIQKYITELLTTGNTKNGSGLSANSVNGIITVIQNSLRLAFALGELKEFTANRLKRPKAKEKEISCFTLAEQKQIESFILSSKKQKLFGILLCLYSGIRIGELLALKWEDVDFTQLKIYYAGKGLHLNDETSAHNLELYIKGTKKYNRLAELMSDENRISIQFARFHGLNKASFAETSEYGKQCLITAIERMVNRLEAENYTKSTITSKQRIDKRLIDADCLKEAFYNAVAHNDWSVTEPAVYMFDDRIEIISYGALPTGETEDMFYRGISKPRNPALMRILKDLGYVEKTGHGVQNIVNRYGRTAFEITESYINVVLSFDKEVMKSKNTDATVNGTVKTIYEHIKQNKNVTIYELIDLVGKSERTIKRNIAQLK